MKAFLLTIFSILTIYSHSQSITRYMPVPPASQQFSMGSCAPIQQTSDGGYLLNYSYGYPGLDASGPIFSEIVKTDSLFTPLWRKELIGENGKKTFSFADGTSIIYTNGDHTTNIAGTGIEKIDISGQTLWTKKYTRTYPYSLLINDAIPRNGSMQFAGCVLKYNGWGFADYTSALLMRIDTAGNLLQADSLSFPPSFPNTTIQNIINDSSGNCYIMGSGSVSYGHSFIAKITSSNTVAWCNNMYSSIHTPSYTASAILSNGDLLTGGSITHDSLGIDAIFLLRFSSTGNLIWSKTINYPSLVGSVQEIDNGAILVTGAHRAAYSDTLKNLILKIDGNGNTLWAKRYKEGFSMSPAYQKSSNDWYFTGFTSEPVLFNTDSTGATNCPYTTFNLTMVTLPFTVTPISCSLNSITIADTTMTTTQTGSQPYLDTCSFYPTRLAEIDHSEKLLVYPNPTTGEFTIEQNEELPASLQIYTLNGKLVGKYKLKGLSSTFNLGNLDNGIYFYTITAGNKVVKRDKIVIIR